ncbi:transcriptional regulator, partial [bacterium]
MRTRFHWWRRSYTIAVIVLAAALVRVWAAWQLPIDADEPVYMNAASDYARLIQAGDLRGVIDYPENREHPALVKLIYSIPHFFIEPQLECYPELTFNRMVSVVFGTLAVWLVAMVDPLAGLLLALQS